MTGHWPKEHRDWVDAEEDKREKKYLDAEVEQERIEQAVAGNGYLPHDEEAS